MTKSGSAVIKASTDLDTSRPPSGVLAAGRQIEVPHKAVAEISRIGPYRRGELLRCMDGRANSLMDRKVVGVVLFGVVAMVAMVPSLTTPGCSVV